MGKYLLKRLLYSAFSVIVAIAIIMVLVYSLMPRKYIFMADPLFAKQLNNQKEVYMHQKWEEYGYLDYVPYTDYLTELVRQGTITDEVRNSVSNIARTESADSANVKEYVKKFTEYYESKGYNVVRLNAKMQTSTKVLNGGQQQLFAYKDNPLIVRMVNFFTKLVTIDNIHYVDKTIDIGKRGISFTLYDPVYQVYNADGSIAKKKFSPAIMGNGTRHKYLLYFNDKFPFIHQNLIKIGFGKSYSIEKGIDVFDSMTRSQGSYVMSGLTYPTGLSEQSAEDLHSATFLYGSRESLPAITARFSDDYTQVATIRSSPSRVGYSFTIGILATLIAYILALPIGIFMARYKDRLFDKIGTFYIVFITAVPALAYIFLFRAIGGLIGFPTTFILDPPRAVWLYYVLPIVSLSLRPIAGLMRWSRRYMIDQMNADYVKFARSGGLSENEIFVKHIAKNASIPIVHNIPGEILFAITGALITERVYVVPGAGGLLISAINAYDNSVIVGMALFYAVLTVLSNILGDLFMAFVDPRISFTTKAR